MESTLSSIQKWYIEQCDGNWEHSYGIKIETVDNPGWFVTIDLLETTTDAIRDIGLIKSEVDDKDWYIIQIKNGQYLASGDPLKLDFLLGKFKELVIENADKWEKDI